MYKLTKNYIFMNSRFEIQAEDGKVYCDMKKPYKNEYFKITIIYLLITIVVPTVLILVCNFFIIVGIYKTNRSISLRKKIEQTNKSKSHRVFHDVIESKKFAISENKKLAKLPKPSVKRQVSFVFKKKYLSTNKIITKISGKTNSSKKLTKMLLFLSFSYAFLNTPYMISWLIFYYYTAFEQANESLRNNLFAYVQICEIFYVLNYGLLFYLYSASGSLFKSRINKTISK